MMRFKPEVRIRDFTDPIAALLASCTQWSLIAGVDVEVNSIDDGVSVHKVGTLHGWSLAGDVDTVGDRAADTEALGEYLRRVLPPGWDVIFEGDHVHAEFDVHRPLLRKVAAAAPRSI